MGNDFVSREDFDNFRVSVCSALTAQKFAIEVLLSALLERMSNAETDEFMMEYRRDAAEYVKLRTNNELSAIQFADVVVASKYQALDILREAQSRLTPKG